MADVTATNSEGYGGPISDDEDPAVIRAINAVDDVLAGTVAGAATAVSVGTNDTSTLCVPITYAVTNEDNVVVGGTAPSYTVTPAQPGAWSFDYTATCADGTTADTASVSDAATSPVSQAIVGVQPSGARGINNNKIGVIGQFSDNASYNDTCSGAEERETEWIVKVNGAEAGRITYQTLSTAITLAGSNASSTHKDLGVDDWDLFLPAIGGSAPGLGDVICVSNLAKNCEGIVSAAPSNEVCFCAPKKQVFAYTGSDQSVTVPTGADKMLVKAWGAGGAGGEEVGKNSNGGSGAFLEAMMSVTPSNAYLIVSGEGGKIASSLSTYG